MPKQQGYVLVDHRASPGLTEAEARMFGYEPSLCKEGKIFEADTMGCSHCGGVAVKSPTRIRPRASCAACGHHYICDGCAYIAAQPGYIHKPVAAQIDDALKSAAQHDINHALGSPAKLILPSS